MNRPPRVGPRLAGADADHLLEWRDEDLAVPDPAAVGGVGDGLDHALGVVIAHRHLDPHLGNKIDHVLGAAIDFGMAFLAPEAAHLGHRHAGNADGAQRVAHVVQLVRLDHRRYEFHAPAPCVPVCGA
jgi:hypothetical protein